MSFMPASITSFETRLLSMIRGLFTIFASPMPKCVMNPSMANLRGSDKILRPIIISNAVHMMDDIGGSQIDAMKAFIYKAMFRKIAIAVATRMFGCVNIDKASYVFPAATFPCRMIGTSLAVLPIVARQVAKRITNILVSFLLGRFGYRCGLSAATLTNTGWNIPIVRWFDSPLGKCCL